MEWGLGDGIKTLSRLVDGRTNSCENPRSTTSRFKSITAIYWSKSFSLCIREDGCPRNLFALLLTTLCKRGRGGRASLDSRRTPTRHPAISRNTWTASSPSPAMLNYNALPFPWSSGASGRTVGKNMCIHINTSSTRLARLETSEHRNNGV